MKNVHILGDSIIKNLNDYFLTKKIRQKYLVKVRSCFGAKINCMADHVKPYLRELSPYHIILHADTNNLKTEKTANEIVNATIDLMTSLKINENLVAVSGIVPRLN